MSSLMIGLQLLHPRTLPNVKGKHLHPRATLPNHETLTQCWLNVGLMSKTVAPHRINIGLTSLVCVASVHEGS